MWAIPLAAIGMILVLVVIVAGVVPSKWFADKTVCLARNDDNSCARRGPQPIEFGLVPADAEPVEPRLAISGTDTFPSDGQIYFVTIREPQLTLLDYLVTRDEPAARFLTHREKFGDQTQEQLLQSGQRQMTGAKDRATYVALKAAGFDVTRKDGPAVVDYTVCLKANDKGTKCLEEAPASEVLEPNDLITKVNGVEITTLDDLSPVLAKVKPGEVIPITIVRNGKTIDTEVKTVAAPGETPVRTIIGFSPVDTTTVQLPKGLSVEFSTGGIGGPSAGLAFTLTLIDELTKGNLMGPQRIAVTGEIDIDGNVGAIGGLNSKAKAVQQVGVKYFLVPASQPDAGNDPDHPNPDSIEAARKVVGDDVEIIPVATLDDALAVLARLGGDPLPAAD